jgi:hypothetical protein
LERPGWYRLAQECESLALAHANVLIDGNWLPGESAEQFAFRMSKEQLIVAALRNVIGIPRAVIEAAQSQEDQ